MDENLVAELKLWKVNHGEAIGRWVSARTTDWPVGGASVALFMHGDPSVIVGFHTAGITWSLNASIPECMDELRAALAGQSYGLGHELLDWLMDRLAAWEAVTGALLGGCEEVESAV